MIHSTIRSMPSRPSRGGKFCLSLVLLASLFAIGSVHAQDAVAVTDTNPNDNTGQTQTNTSNIAKQIGGSTSSSASSGSSNPDTLNGHLKNIDTIGTSNAPASSSSAVAAPQVALADMSNLDTSPCNSVASAQQPNCTAILQTQNSQYQYMKAMYDITSSREKDLKALVAARQALQKEDYGQLEDNTNKLIALRAQMDIDRQQMESANNAYNLRISYLQSQQSQLAQNTNTGGSSSGSSSIITNTISQIVSGAILKTALSVQQTDNGAQTLKIEGTNGF